MQSTLDTKQEANRQTLKDRASGGKKMKIFNSGAISADLRRRHSWKIQEKDLRLWGK